LPIFNPQVFTQTTKDAINQQDWITRQQKKCTPILGLVYCKLFASKYLLNLLKIIVEKIAG